MNEQADPIQQYIFGEACWDYDPNGGTVEPGPDTVEPDPSGKDPTIPTDPNIPVGPTKPTGDIGQV